MSTQGVFRQLQEFVEAHKACGEVTRTVESPTAEGYAVCVSCVCGQALSRWVTPQSARYDLIFSTLLCHPN